MLAELRAGLDRRQVHEGDSVTLTIERDGTGPSASPDLTPLQQDFEVQGTSQGSQIRIVNGVRSDTTSWQITLAPKHAGVLAIPSITMGTERTQPLSLTVAAAPQGALGQPGDNLFVEVEVGEGNRALSEGVMVQEQVPLTVRLFSARPLIGGDLSEPRVADAVISKLGEDRQYRTQRDGRDYAVVERRYSLSPEKSGDLQIPPIVFKGSVRSAQGQNQRRGIPGGVFDDPGLDRFFQAPALERFFGGSDPFGAFERGEPVRAQSKALDLRVQARPEGVAGSNWLPAQGLEIADSWTKNPPQLRVGEPVSRTLTLTAKGLAGAQIPTVDLPAVDGLRVYPEQSQHETRTDGETIYGVSHQGLTLIPSQAGALAIPEVRVTWWDTTAQREQVATLPAWNLEVEAAAGQAAAQPLATAPSPPQTAAAQPTVPPPDQAAGNAPSDAKAGQHPGQGAEPQAAPGPARIPFYQRPNLYVGLALVITGVVGLVVLRRRRSAVRSQGSLAAGTEGSSAAKPQAAAQGLGSGETSAVKRALREACDANDPKAAAKALLRWAEAVWPEAPPRSLGALAIRITPAAL
ncbi:MAG TPA: BatD family protein, partial [Chromatiaceae bacterium]|nr:BatD family protein [Chromatiaceae bacterium]